MKKIFFLLYVFMVLGSRVCISQTDDNGAPYFPLRVGNAFYYIKYVNSPGVSDSSFVVSRITGTKIFNGKRYFYCTNILGRNNINYFIRYNRNTGNLVYLDTNNTECDYEISLYNLSANVGDSVSSYCRSTQYKCNSISDSVIFNTSAKIKNFGYYNTTIGFVSRGNSIFANRIGCIFDGEAIFHGSGNYSAFSQYLLGCKINGIVRGDTINHITPNYADSGRYMPLAIGNKWVYLKTYSYGTHDEITYSKVVSKITKDTIVNGNRYFYVENFAGPSPSYWVRYDGNTGRLIRKMIYSSCGGDFTLYNFAYTVGDSSSVDTCSANSYWVSNLYDTLLFGINSKTKQYYYQSSGWHYSNHYNTEFTKNIGPSFYEISMNTITGYNCETYQLIGCELNGVAYGDTTSVIPPSLTDSSRYYPLKIGNKYYYKRNYTYHTSIPDTTIYDSSYYVIRITDTTRLHGKLYYKMNSFISGTRGYFRHDLDSGFLFSYDSLSWCTNYPYEFKCFMLSSNANQDGSGMCWLNNYYSRCFQIHDTSALGSTRKVKGFMTTWGGTSGGHYYTLLIKDIGVCQYEGYSYSNSSGYYSLNKYKLIGAFVDGIKYGDTITTGIQTISNVLPDKFELYQNYPNPFNPTTNIKYTIPSIVNRQSSMVTLKIFDILGKEIATLVNEKQSPGTYEVSWDASAFPSGVYFYKLITGDFSEVKKALLIK